MHNSDVRITEMVQRVLRDGDVVGDIIREAQRAAETRCIIGDVVGDIIGNAVRAAKTRRIVGDVVDNIIGNAVRATEAQHIRHIVGDVMDDIVSDTARAAEEETRGVVSTPLIHSRQVTSAILRAARPRCMYRHPQAPVDYA